MDKKKLIIMEFVITINAIIGVIAYFNIKGDPKEDFWWVIIMLTCAIISILLWKSGMKVRKHYRNRIKELKNEKI